MRAILALFIALAVVLVFVGTSAAAPGGDVKSSPLFKRSLEESIASLEGKTLQTDAALGEPAAMPTGKPGCPQPDLPETQASTCEPSVCGGVTCGGPTCQGWPTCYNTCWNTCSGSTCTTTCAGGSCQYHYIWRGQNWWNFQGNRGTNWNYLDYPPGGYKESFGHTEVTFVGSNPPPKETTIWPLDTGYYEINKWYQNAITNLYDVQSNIRMKLFLQDPWTIYYSILVHSLSPPSDSGIGIPIDFYFYD
jgi:hypothetical protein